MVVIDRYSLDNEEKISLLLYKGHRDDFIPNGYLLSLDDEQEGYESSCIFLSTFTDLKHAQKAFKKFIKWYEEYSSFRRIV